MSLGAVLEIDEGCVLHERARPIEYIVTEKGCWECVSHLPDTKGYPVVKRGGRQYKTHRHVYEALEQRIGDSMCLCHRCDNTLCINPSHMFEGTKQENNEDRHTKGRTRGAVGERARAAKLTRDEVLRVREFHSTGDYSQVALGKMFCISQSVISRIVRRQTWRHI